MKRKIIASLVLATILTTGAFAQNNFNKNDSNCLKNNNHKSMMNHKMRKNKDGLLFLVKKLNLDEKQKTKIKNIMEEKSKNVKTISAAFTSSSFDKNKYIQIIKDKKDNMIKLRADKMEKIYKVLNAKQKNQFKVLLDLQTEKKLNMKNRGKHFDKRFNGRG